MKDFQNQLSRLVQNAMDRSLLDLHTALPGVVDNFDPLTGTADIQIAIKRVKADGEEQTVEVLPKVPIIYPRTANFSFYFPLDSGDTVQLVFNERALDNFKNGTGSVGSPAGVARRHAYADAVAIPSFSPNLKGATNFLNPRRNDDAPFMAFSGGYLGFDADGLCYIGSENGVDDEPLVLGNIMLSCVDDLMTRVSELIELVDEGFTKIATGPVATGNLGAPAPTYPALVTDLTALSVDLGLLSVDVEANRVEYVSTPATNIVSQIAFTDRGLV